MSPIQKTDLFDLLRKVGHSALKAIEITLDYERGDKKAVEIVNSAKDQVA